MAESEPNDWDSSNDYDSHDGAGGDITISGQIACSPNWEADMDWYVVDFPCEDQARVTLDWSGNSDLDFWIYDANEDWLAENNDEDYSGPVTEQVAASSRLYLAVGCWTGPNVSYTLEIDFAPWGWDPPEEGDDDDGDDDDDDGDPEEGQTPEGDPSPTEEEEDEDDGSSPPENSAEDIPQDGLGCGCDSIASEARPAGALLGFLLFFVRRRRGSGALAR